MSAAAFERGYLDVCIRREDERDNTNPAKFFNKGSWTGNIRDLKPASSIKFQGQRFDLSKSFRISGRYSKTRVILDVFIFIGTLGFDLAVSVMLNLMSSFIKDRRFVLVRVFWLRSNEAMSMNCRH